MAGLTIDTPSGEVDLAPDLPALHEAPPKVDPVRRVYGAAHVVLQPDYGDVAHSLDAPGSAADVAAHIDWDATMAFRRHLDRHGFGVAEAMDTAQRFFLGWDGAKRLIRECGALELDAGFCAGAGTDQVAGGVNSKTGLVDAVVEQVRYIQECGGIAVLLPMPWLPLNGANEADYVDVYTGIIAECDGPLILHWLGPMFLPVLEGYFPGDSFGKILAFDPGKVRGCKLSNLDDAQEYRIRHEILARDQIVLTGDDFHFGRLMRGDRPDAQLTAAPEVQRWGDLDGRPMALGDFSHGLLGIFDGIAAPAGRALQWLAGGDVARYEAIMEPCETLGQVVFEAPTQHYKAGLAFLAWLNGLQDTFYLVNHEQRARSLEHLCSVANHAARCGAIENPALAAGRLQNFVQEHGER